MQSTILMIFLLVNPGFFFGNDKPVCHWDFENIQDENVVDVIENITDELQGLYKIVEGPEGKAIQFDGYTTKIIRKKEKAPILKDKFSFEAWVAFQAYPFGRCAIINQCDQIPVRKQEVDKDFFSQSEMAEEFDPKSGYFFGVDAKGYVLFQVFVNNKWEKLKSSKKIELHKWTHIAGVFHKKRGMAIYINGQEVGINEVEGEVVFAKKDIIIGTNMLATPPQYPIRINLPAKYSFDGFIDEVKIYDKAIKGKTFARIYEEDKDSLNTGMTFRKLPVKPSGPAEFGAYYCKMEFDELWDKRRREEEHTDIVVLFDNKPWRYVFWRGTNYIPHWVTENNIWYNNEFVKTWGNGALGCAGPMSDKQSRMSQVRIIENNNARVVIHWRYALIDARYIFSRMDDVTGWGDWVDEYHYIYPDGIGIRKIILHTSQPTEPHEFQESIVLMQPGQRPEDNIQTKALTMINQKGEFYTYDWSKGAPANIDKPAGRNIELINTKSQAKPFLIVADGPFKDCPNPKEILIDGLSNDEKSKFLKKFNNMSNEEQEELLIPARKRIAEILKGEKKWIADEARFYAVNSEIKHENSIFPWWNHWPVAQIPSDGRWATEFDRVSHSSITTGLWWKDLELTENKRVRAMMMGLTEKNFEELAKLSKSWNNPPKLKIISKGYKNNGYEYAEKAYKIECKDQNEPLTFKIIANKNSPGINPLIIIKNWGKPKYSIKINDWNIDEGREVRLGIRRTLEGNDLLLWLKMDKEIPVKVQILREKGLY